MRLNPDPFDEMDQGLRALAILLIVVWLGIFIMRDLLHALPL